jgi:chorismate mutase
MSENGEGDQQALARLRERIDAVDAEMHRLLIERASVIDELIRTKRTDRPAAAFRPGREADMMRRIVARHQGSLPLFTVEHIWREIIATFTRLQAPFDVAIDTSVEPDRMRDLARFAFGFSVALKPAASAEAVVAAVAAGNNLGLVAQAAPGPWWRGLAGERAPKIMAMLPFIAAQGRPADLPAFVVSPPLADGVPFDIAVFALTVGGEFAPPADLGTVLARSGVDVLFAASRTIDADELRRRLAAAGAGMRSLSPVGGFARGIAIGAPSSLLHETADARS